MKDKKEETQIYLFLDDVREPIQAFTYTKLNIFRDKDWAIVRNFEEFKTYIETNGIPYFISFDHDLADSHYTPKHLWDNYEASKKWQEEQIHTEKTGYDCALWLLQYCSDNNLKLPNHYCHSMNPVGKDKINRLFL